MGKSGRRAAALLLCGLVWGAPLEAVAIYGDSDDVFGLDGSARTFVFGLFPPDLEFTSQDDDDRVDGLTTFLLRLVAAGRPTETVKYEVHGVWSSVLNAASGQTGGLSPFGGQGSDSVRLRYRLWDASRSLSDAPDVSSEVSLERANLRVYLPYADIVLGRQAISFGKAYLWNPLDIFRPFDPTTFDRDYKTGVDALNVTLPLGDESELTFVGSLSHEEANRGHGRWYGAAAVARFATTVAGWDAAVQTGKVYGGFQGGAAVSGEVGDLAVRFEVSHFEPLEQDVFLRHQAAVLGIGYAFESGLKIEAEYFYNGGGAAFGEDALGATLEGTTAALMAEASADPAAFCARAANLVPAGTDCVDLVSDPAALAALAAGAGAGASALDAETRERLTGFAAGVLDGRLYHTSTHLVGMVVQHELTPLLNASLAGIVSLSDQSLMIQPGLVYSAADEVDMVMGALLSSGERAQGEPPFCAGIGGCPASEFGTFPHVIYLQSKIYF